MCEKVADEKESLKSLARSLNCYQQQQQKRGHLEYALGLYQAHLS